MIKALIANQFVRYVIASAIALCVDYGSYWVIAETTNLSLPTGAAIGYSIGLIVAYFLIAGPVIKDGWLSNRKKVEILLFALSGGLGILVTYTVVFIYVRAIGIDLHESKFAAVGLIFLAVYLFRRYLVFPKRNSDAILK